MNFAALPPEINSGLIYTGPGSAPMLAAAAAWDGLAGELQSAAAAYESVVSGLTGEAWRGPSAVSMTAAITPYLAWMNSTAGQAEQAAVQAKAAATSYETAFAMTVPPAMVAANRAQLMMLVATNLLGQNTAAIAATEAQYAEMWVQDATTMYGYAAAAAAAAELTPFAPPPQTANPAGPAGQAAAVAQSTGTQALPQLTTALPDMLQSLVSPTQAVPAGSAAALQIPDPPTWLAPTLSIGALGVAATAASLNPALSGAAMAAAANNSRLLALNGQAILNNTEGIISTQDQLKAVFGELGLLPNAAAAGPGAAPGPLSAGLGQAGSVGRLSVPSGWATAAPEIRTTAYALPTGSLGGVPAAAAGGTGSAFSEMALAGMGGSALAGTVGRGRDDGTVATARVCPPLPGTPVRAIAAELRELAELRDGGVLTEAEFNDRKQRLLSS